PRRGLARPRGRLAAILLRRDDARDLVAAAIVLPDTADRVGPRRTIRRIAGEKRRDGGKIVGVVGCQPADPGEAPDVHGHAHERFVGGGGRRRGVLHRKTYCLKASSGLSTRVRRDATISRNVRAIAIAIVAAATGGSLDA